MKKIEKRAAFCLLLAAALFAGLCLFCFRFVVYGGEWASFPANRHLYNNQGVLLGGQILDRNGMILSSVSDGNRVYAENKNVRRATLHAVGDAAGNIGTGAQTVFADRLSGYNFLTGAFSLFASGNDLQLTLDAELCRVAYEALDGRRGAVGVYNYETGELVCMVSTPTFDPANPPSYEEIQSNEQYNGVFVNRFLSATFTPGSVFKTITIAAALDTLPGIRERTFTCEGSLTIGGTTITCPSVHGQISLEEALAVSCNCVFGTLSTEVGADKMQEYTKNAGLLDSISVSGIPLARGRADYPTDDPGNLAWAGIGQHHDLMNPCAIMIYMGAIARGGIPVLPQLVQGVEASAGIPLGIYIKKQGARMLSESTAMEISDMMRNNVVSHYGEKRFPEMSLCAKSGTAEVGADKKPNAWFAGFSRDATHPYAFVVMVENGGGGNSVAGGIAGTVLRALWDSDL